MSITQATDQKEQKSSSNDDSKQRYQLSKAIEIKKETASCSNTSSFQPVDEEQCRNNACNSPNSLDSHPSVKSPLIYPSISPSPNVGDNENISSTPYTCDADDEIDSSDLDGLPEPSALVAGGANNSKDKKSKSSTNHVPPEMKSLRECWYAGMQKHKHLVRLCDIENEKGDNIFLQRCLLMAMNHENPKSQTDYSLLARCLTAGLFTDNHS